MSVRTELALRHSTVTEAMFLRKVISSPRNKSSDVLELLVSYGLILAINWSSNSIQEVFYWAAAIWIGGSTAPSLVRKGTIDLRMAEFRRSLWFVGLALILGSSTVALATKMHPLQQSYGPMVGVEAFVGYTVWAIAQQWLLQAYFLPRVARITPRNSWAAAIVAALFAIAHLPNVLLALMALFWGLAASFLFLRYRSVVALGLAHAILGITVAISVPGPWLHNMRVGLGYIEYRKPLEVRLVLNDRSPSQVTRWVDRDLSR